MTISGSDNRVSSTPTVFAGLSRAAIVGGLLLLVLPRYLNDAYNFVMSAQFPVPSLAQKLAFWLGDLIIYALWPITVLVVAFRRGWLAWADLAINTTRPARTLLAGTVLFIAFWLLMTVQYFSAWNTGLVELYPSASYSQFFFSGDDGVGFLLLGAFYLAVSSAVLEEVIYRALLIEGLMRLGCRSFAALSISVLVFAAIHLSSGAATVVSAGIAGLIFGCVYLWQRYISGLILAHFLFNLLEPLGWFSALRDYWLHCCT